MTEEQVFLAALDLPDEAARAAYLDEHCGADPALRGKVEALLAAHFKSGEFMQIPAGEQICEQLNPGPAVTLQSDDMSADQDPQDELDSLEFLAPSNRPDSLGRIGRYEVLEVVGKGGFGIVLRAFDDQLQRVVAIKVMAPQLAVTSPARKRFLREARSSAQVRHENVVQVYGVEEQPLPYLVMEFIPGETLQQRLDRVGPLDVQETLRIGRQIAEGLAAAHAQDLIHRDIKPGNILLETGMRDRVKITDFGLARAADDASMTQSGMIAGTPMYMAPEQALGQKLDQRADLFSFGSVLYQMVSGRPPFRASSTLAVLKRLTEETPRPIQEIIPETPQWLCDIISKLQAKNADDRFQSAKEVAELLEQHLAHLQNPSQVSRPMAVSLAPAAEQPAPSTPSKNPEYTGPEMRPLMVPQGVRWPLVIASGILFLAAAVLLVIAETNGLTKLFRGSKVAHVNSPPVAPQPELVFGEDSLPGKWVQLFNGKNLEGWVRNSDFPGNWRVEAGILVGSGPDQIGLLQSARKDFENFHLRAEVLVNSDKADGGIFFRSLSQSSNELNLCFDPNLPTQQTGSLVIHKPGTKNSTWHSAPAGLAKVNEWMTVEIIAQGNQATTRINGQTAAISQSLCGNPIGHIMLQHLEPQAVVRFRKIEIKELPTISEPPLAVKLADWGTFVDPRGECSQMRTGRTVSIRVPGTRPYNLVPTTAFNLDAPRLVQELEGDFLIQTTVMPYERPKPNTSSRPERPVSFRAAGLLVWVDGQNFLRFERASYGEQTTVAPYLNMEWYVGGQSGNTGETLLPTIPEAPTLLQIERRGTTLFLRRSDDGRTWQEAAAVSNMDLPKRVSVGLVVSNSTNTDFTAAFDNLRLRGKETSLEEPGWVQLFNGKDLTGWKTHPEKRGDWEVKEGVLIGGKSQGYLFTAQGDFKDFHLRMSARINEGGDSGVYFRAPFAMRPGRQASDLRPAAGYEMELHSQPRHAAPTGSLWDAAASGPPILLQRSGDAFRTPSDEWVPVEIIAQGHQFTTKINGVIAAECADRDQRYDAGHIALQAFHPQTTVEFRKIEIKELPPTEPKAKPLE